MKKKRKFRARCELAGGGRNYQNFKPWEELARRVSVELRVLHHPDERMGRRLEAEPELDELLRIRARDATEGRS